MVSSKALLLLACSACLAQSSSGAFDTGRGAADEMSLVMAQNTGSNTDSGYDTTPNPKPRSSSSSSSPITATATGSVSFNGHYQQGSNSLIDAVVSKLGLPASTVQQVRIFFSSPDAQAVWQPSHNLRGSVLSNNSDLQQCYANCDKNLAGLPAGVCEQQCHRR